jgi:hypothetical protein
MDCLVCNQRSAVESCAICHTLLCETCGARCETCGILVCPDHRYKTHKGNVLCIPCQEKRRAVRRAEKYGETDPALKEASAADALPLEEEEERPILLASVRKPPPAWKLSIYTAGAAVLVALIMLLIPDLRRITLPWGGHLPTPIPLMIIPAMSLFWSVLGYFDKENQDSKNRGYIGLGIALLSVLLLVAAIFTDPARKTEADEKKVQDQRNQMSTEELKKWRQEKLQKFK